MLTLSFAAVMNGWSSNNLQQEWFRSFVHSLRSDFKLPSDYEMQRAVEKLYTSVGESVVLALAKEQVCTLAFDGLSDSHHHPILGISTLVPSGRSEAACDARAHPHYPHRQIYTPTCNSCTLPFNSGHFPLPR